MGIGYVLRLFGFFILLLIGVVVDVFYFNFQLASSAFLLLSFLYLVTRLFWRGKSPLSKYFFPVPFVLGLGVFFLASFFGGLHDEWIDGRVRELGREYLAKKNRTGEFPDGGKFKIHGNLIVFSHGNSGVFIFVNKFNFRRDSFDVQEGRFLGVKDI